MSFIDSAILILILGLALIGFLKGFFKSFFSFFSFIVSLTLTILFVNAVAKSVFTIPAVGNWVAGEKGSLFSWFRSHLPSALDDVKMSEIRDVYNQSGSSGVKAYFKTLAAGDVFKDSFFGKFFIKICYPLIGSSLTNSAYLTSGIDSARELIALDLAYALYVFIVGVVLFIVLRVLSIVFSLFFKSLLAKKNTLIGRCAGAGIGAVKGFIYCAVVLAMLALFSNFGFMSGVSKKMDDSVLAKPLLKVSSVVSSKVMQGGGKAKYTRLIKKAGFENDVYTLTYKK